MRSVIIGVDFGNRNAVISVAKRGGIDTLLNEASKRATPQMVSFQGKQRFMGNEAEPLRSSNFKNTVVNFKRLIGKNWSDPDVQNEIAKCPNKQFYKELDGDKIGVQVNYQDEQMVMTPEDVCAMMIASLRSTAEFSTERPVSDIVFSVPAHWNDRQRRAFLSCSKVANVDVLGLINDGTAAALSYGIWKSASNQFDAEKKEYVMFVDMGESAFQVTIAAYVQGKLTVIANAYDSSLGGRDVDWILANYFANEFKKKYGDSPLDNPKATLKLLTGCEKLKQTFTPEGVTEAPMKIEYLLNEIDFNSQMTLETFEELIAPLIERIAAPLEQAMESSGLSVDQLSAVEILGGASRTRAVKKRIAEVLGLDMTKPMFGLKATQNADECISRGCALRCAILSPAFRVKEFAIKDTVIFPINVTWEQTEALNNGDKEEEEEDSGAHEAGNGENSITLFDKGREIPLSRRIIFRRHEPFEVQASYSEEVAKCLPSEETNIGSFRISGMVPNEEPGLPPKIRVDFKEDEFGLFRIVKAEQMQEIKAEVVASPEPAAANPPDANAEENDKKSDSKEEKSETEGGEKINSEGNDEGKDNKEESKEEKPAKKKFKVIKLNVESAFYKGATESDLLNSRAREQEFQAQDKLIKDTLDARNNLEEAVYSNRSKISDSLVDFSKENEREELSKLFTDTENWLYEEGYDEIKKVYEEKLKSLLGKMEPIYIRQRENENRPGAAQSLKDEVAANLAIVNSPDEKYAHLSDEDRDLVRNACEKSMKWLDENLGKQADISLNENPVLFVVDIDSKTKDLHNECRPIVTKPKPTPPKPTKEEKSKDEKKTGEDGEVDDKKTEDNTNSTAENEGESKENTDSQENDMDVD